MDIKKFFFRKIFIKKTLKTHIKKKTQNKAPFKGRRTCIRLQDMTYNS